MGGGGSGVREWSKWQDDDGDSGASRGATERCENARGCNVESG